MNRKLGLLFVGVAVFFLLALPEMASGALVFSENFEAGNFAAWTKTYVGTGGSQTVSGGVARFITPAPPAGTATYSYLQKDGFTSTPNSALTASEDVCFPKVPSGCPQGVGAFFFFYLCDTSDLTGKAGNFGVGIDGSQAWSLWIGGNPPAAYVFQTQGPQPASNTWYHVVLTVNNPAATVTLTVDGTEVIRVSQQQFTDKTRQVSLLTGMGEDWHIQTSGPHEIDIDNVALEISDMNAPPPSATVDPTTPSPSQPPRNSGSHPTQTPQSTPTPQPPASSTPQPTSSATLPPANTQTTTPENNSPLPIPFWIVLPVGIIVAAGIVVVVSLKKR